MSSSLDHEDRQGAHVCDSSDEHGGESDSHALECRPGQAERKRQLERNRRNLINARFIELSTELQRSEDTNGNIKSRDSPRVKRPRMDKEALLKEATMRLIVQHKELTSSSARLRDLLAQIDAMRIEMDDLRTDKTYLRNEVQRLRVSNTNLWKVIHHSPSLNMSAMCSPSNGPSNRFGRVKSQARLQKSHSPASGTDTSLGVTNICSTTSNDNQPSVSKPHVQSMGLSCALPFSGFGSSQREPFEVPKSTGRVATSAPSQTPISESDPSLSLSCLDDLGALFSNTAPARTSIPSSSAMSAAAHTSLGFRTS